MATSKIPGSVYQRSNGRWTALAPSGVIGWTGSGGVLGTRPQPDVQNAAVRSSGGYPLPMQAKSHPSTFSWTISPSTTVTWILIWARSC